MKTLTLITLVCLSGVLASVVDQQLLSESDRLINEINSKQSLWKAGRNFDPNTPKSELRALLGLKKKPSLRAATKKVHHVMDTEIPDTFDARLNWFNCGSIKRISDQSACGSCWAVATADAMSDRICVASNMQNQPKVSAANLMQCCTDCGFGCQGGDPFNAWNYWITDGIVTGGANNSNDGCQNYPFESCEHHNAEGRRPACPAATYETPTCVKQCDTDDISYEDSLTYGTVAYILDDVQSIQAEIMKNGPVVAGFSVYEDFLYYKSGIYQHVSGEEEGGHAVRIIGWGEEDGVKYWLIANSWNDDWGDQGLIKMIRGVNEGGIEEEVTAGIPKL